MFKISVAIITLNEERQIGRCIDSVKEIADEVLVVDSFSTDNTQAISESKGARFIQNKFEGHIEQKNFALSKTSFDHVLSLDADEALSSDAIQEIKKIKSSGEFHNYSFNRLTNYCGKWIHHCGWYPDRKLRLVDRRNAFWGGENPHDKLILKKGTPIHLKADIFHYSFPTIASHVATANSFSDIAARQAILKKRKIYFVIHVLLNPVFTFFKKYLVQLGFLDGFYGFVICRISAYSNFLKYSKIWQLKHENPNIKN
jgi:glycosyltransferase involved in cell wall biosynthesis